MGTIQHDSIIVTGWEEKNLSLAHEKAKEIFNKCYIENAGIDNEYRMVSDIVGTGMNGYKSFFIGSDGSKEGWDMSDKYDSKREEFVSFLETLCYEDGSSNLDWVWVNYGECGTEIHKTNCED